MISDASLTVAIVGAGFSGTMVAVHLLKNTQRPLTIKLIDSNDIGKGVAYSTTSNSHLLNVPAAGMSAFPDDSSHLLRWLKFNYHTLKNWLPNEPDPSLFIPRLVYGLYIQSILQEAEATAPTYVKLERIIDEVVGIQPQNRGAIVCLKNQDNFAADKIVLAIGNGASPPPLSLGKFQPDATNISLQPSYIHNAWSKDALTGLEVDDSVLLIGTGLTMVDMVMSLRDRHHQGKIYAVSRHGLMPLSHQPSQPYPAFLTKNTAPKTIRGLLKSIRAEIKTATQLGYNWQSVIDSLRPVTQELWQELSAVEQKRFLRHVNRYWDIHRHRLASEICEIIEDLILTKKLIIKSGRISHCAEIDSGILVNIYKDNYHSNIQVKKFINCTGIQVDYRTSTQSLIANLRTQGLICPNPLGLGLYTLPNGAILDAQGQGSSLLYTLGPPRKGDLWETTAIREIREQAKLLATTILNDLPLWVRPVAPLSTYNHNNSSALNLLFRQLFDQQSNTYTYLIADLETKQAVLVDTVLAKIDRDLQLINDWGLNLCYCLETHLHADHITGAGQLKKLTGCQILVPKNDQIKGANRQLDDGDIVNLGSVNIQAIATPGHTNSHLAYLINHRYLLTGDALFIRGCGRTDLQSGDAGTLYDTVTQKLFTLSDDIWVYPAHDYQGRTVSTIGEEKRCNPRLSQRSREEFITLMENLDIIYPSQMAEAIAANEWCGDRP
ncbi:FAD/NAD(P)-binding protein [Limnospira platensis CENA597]|uniref:FAD/NAD(P)-binding protein n=1 Tax=Limnospira platensis TaxID=118562 RepID=UPI003DA068DC